VLDECLSAYLDGRRSIDESLSLYPSLRPQLEPLLRTAVDLAESLQAESPPPYIVERGRQRFLESAANRRRAYELTRDIPLSRLMSRAWGRAQWAVAAGAFAVTIFVVAFSARALDSGSRDPAPQAQVILDDSPPAVSDLRETQERLRVQTIENGHVSSGTIRRLVATTSELETQVADFGSLDERSQQQLQQALGYQYLLLNLVIDTQPRAVAPAAREALGLTEDLAEEWGLELPDLPPAVSATPSAFPSASAGPSATPDPSPGPSTTPQPSESPTPTPEPAEELP
jgi:hypothetical protein